MKRTTKKQAKPKLTVVPQQDPVKSTVSLVAADGSEHVRVYRHVEGDLATSLADPDPTVDVYFDGMESPLHPGEHRPCPMLGPIRVSDLWTYVDSLNEALRDAVASGMIPARLPDEEWQFRYNAVRRQSA